MGTKYVDMLSELSPMPYPQGSIGSKNTFCSNPDPKPYILLCDLLLVSAVCCVAGSNM